MALVTHWKIPTNVVKDAQTGSTVFNMPNQWIKTNHFEQWMMAIDTSQYMVDDILVKVDRAAMANSLETRVPMLDHRVVEFAWQLPLDFKIKNGVGKSVLREVLYRHVPRINRAAQTRIFYSTWTMVTRAFKRMG